MGIECTGPCFVVKLQISFSSEAKNRFEEGELLKDCLFAAQE